MRRWMVLLCLLTLGATPPPEDVDPLAVAARLVADGWWDRAEVVLAEVDASDPDLDRVRFWMLRGLLLAHDGDHEGAVEDLKRSVEAGGEPRLRLAWARSLGQLERWTEAAAVLDDSVDSWPEAWSLRARALHAADRASEAWTVLEQATARFPEESSLVEQRLGLAIELELYQTVLEVGRELLTPTDAARWLALGEALLQARRAEEAALLLEEARLRFPEDPRAGALLARALLELGRPAAAGEVLAVAAVRDPSLHLVAAECFRRAGDLRRALHHNGQVADAAAKARQRLGLLVAMESWGRAAALEERLVRLELTDDDSTRYALAYAWYRLGDHDAASGWLDGIADASIFRDATALRDAMVACETDPRSCP